MKYDPLVEPDPERWLASEESDRLDAVIRYHRRAKIALPRKRLHAIIHMAVENQAALGAETPVADALRRLTDEGLDRHEAIHAVGSVLAGQIYEMLGSGETDVGDPNAAYYEKVRTLTAQKWRDEYGEPDDAGA